MPSFDIVSKTDLAEVDNAINSAMREITTRYDFKNSQSKISRESNEIELMAEDQYKIDQVQQIFRRQKSKIVQGIDREISQKINKIIKNSKFKVQFSIRGEELRITGAKRDVLQEVIQTIKNLEIKQPLQFINFRD
jgi:hypothetical protein